MQKTYTFTITLDELDARRAAEVLAEAGLTPEGVIGQLLERTAREGAIPLKKTRTPKKRRTEAECPGLFKQGDLFAAFEAPEVNTIDDEPLPPVDTTLHPSLPTIASLQEAQAKLRWRARERESAEGQSLIKAPNQPLELLETKQFRVDKSSIIDDPRRPAIINALEKLFTDITTRQTPADVQPIDNGDSLYVPIHVEGTPLRLIYQVGEGEICLVRYGRPQDLLLNPEAL